MEFLIPLVVTLFALFAIFLIVFAKSRIGNENTSLAGLFLGLWLFSSSVFNTYFFSFKFVGMFDLSIERILFIILLLIFIFDFFRHNFTIRFDLLFISILLFLIVCVISMFINGFEPLMLEYPRPWFVFFSGYFLSFFIFLYVRDLLKSSADFKFIFLSVFLFGVYLCLTAFLEHFGAKNFVFPQYIVSDKFPLHLDRARGPFLNSAFDGLAINQGFISGLFLLNSTDFKNKKIVTILMLLFPCSIFFCRTRSAYLAFIYLIVLILFGLQTKFQKWKMIPVIISIVVVLISVFSDRIFSSKRETGGIYQVEEVNIRYALIEKSKKLIMDNPFTGVGLAHFSSASKSTGEEVEMQHNHLIGMTVELGLFGVLSYLVILIIIFKRVFSISYRSDFQNSYSINMLLILFSGLAVNLINNTFVEPALFPIVGCTTFLYAGIIDKFYYNEYF